MNKNILRFGLLMLALISVIVSILPQESSARMPGGIYYKDTGELESVRFSHSIHLSYGNTCNDCHNKIFQMRIGQANVRNAMTMKTMEEGKFCGTCHNGKRAFSVQSDCDQCHFK
jgi:c(7)-type cytochrome triheme protein